MKIEDVMSDDLIVGYVPGTVKDALKILAKNTATKHPKGKHIVCLNLSISAVLIQFLKERVFET